MPKGRIAHIDMAAGIMILWMMLGHIGASQLGYCTPQFVQFLGRFLFFFMPWFFFKSGMFFSLSAARITGGQIVKAIRGVVDNRISDICNYPVVMENNHYRKSIFNIPIKTPNI